MLSWAAVFFIISIIAAVFGFTNVAADSARPAKVMFAIFFIMFIVSFALQLLT